MNVVNKHFNVKPFFFQIHTKFVAGKRVSMCQMNIISLMRNRIEGKEEVSETGDVEQVVRGRTVF